MSRFVLQISPIAADELYDAMAWYEEKKEGLGAEFTEEVFNLLKLLQKKPYLFGVKFAPMREAVLKRFPYIVAYRVEGDFIYVDAIFHTSRDPEKKQDR